MAEDRLNNEERAQVARLQRVGDLMDELNSIMALPEMRQYRLWMDWQTKPPMLTLVERTFNSRTVHPREIE